MSDQRPETDAGTVVTAGPQPLETQTATEDEPAAEGVAKKKLGVAAWLAIAWLAIVVFTAVFAGLLPVEAPNARVRGLSEAPPFEKSGHLLGGDKLGRDLFARLVYGARSSLLVATCAVGLGLLIGGALGLIAGYYRSRLGTILTASFDILLAFPQLVLALALVAFLRGAPSTGTATGAGAGAATGEAAGAGGAAGEGAGAGAAAAQEGAGGLSTTAIIILALGIVSIPILARITRANSLAWSQREFVLAAKAQGAKNSRIMIREVLPNVLPAMFSIALLGMAVAIIAEGGLSLLGVGIELPTASWGNIIAEGRAELRDAPHIVFLPVIAIFLTVLALNYLGDVVRDRFDVRESAL